MNPDQLKTAGIRLFGRSHWKARLAEALAVDVSTIHRIGKRAEVPGPVEVAVKGLLQHKRAQEVIEKEARALGLRRPAKRSEDGVPRKFRKRPETSKRVRRHKEKKREEAVDLDDSIVAVLPIVGD